MKKLVCLLYAAMIAILPLGCSQPAVKREIAQYTNYQNDHGVGFFYPENNAVLSGIAKVYGLAYTGEGWLETDKGIGRVVVDFGGKLQMDARTYVKDRYWVRTFDAAGFADGPMTITATAYDKGGSPVGSAACTVTIDNSHSPVQRRLYAAPEGKGENRGTKDSPWDLATGIDNLQPGDVLFLRGGTYTQDIVLQKSGSEGKPLTVMNYSGEKVELVGAGIRIGFRKEYIDILGIDQHGLRQGASGVELADGVKHIGFWDCSFNDNTHPYDKIPENNELSFGTGFYSGTTYTQSQEGNRKDITVSHCAAMYNDVDGFNFSSIDHGRFQFIEAAWNPNHKNADIFQYKHANGFVNKNSDYEGWGFASEDNVYLFCYAHHNGQDGWDIRSPHSYLFGCVSHDTAQAGHEYGGMGYKFWEYDYKAYNCLCFRNNLVDDSGGGLVFAGDGKSVNGSYASVLNCVFADMDSYAVMREKTADNLFFKNDIFFNYRTAFTVPLPTTNCTFYGNGNIPISGQNMSLADPGFLNPFTGNYFLKDGSPALTSGDLGGMTFYVDGVDYSGLDSLGRPRAGEDEAGPYTRYAGADAALYVPAPAPAATASVPDSSEETSNLDVKVMPIKIDGSLDDWKDAPVYRFAKSTGGKALQYEQEMSVVWDGKDRLFVRGTIREPPGRVLNKEALTSSSWWNDDVFEIFLNDLAPSADTGYSGTVRHYALSSRHVFLANDLKHDARAAIMPLANGRWSFEMEIPLDGAMMSAITDGMPLYAKFGVELNSAGEASLLYNPEDGFWGLDSYQTLYFK